MNDSLPSHDIGVPDLEQVLERHLAAIQQLASPAVHCAYLDLLKDCVPLHSSAIHFEQRGVKSLIRGQPSRSSVPSEQEGNFGEPFEPQLQSSLALNHCLLILNGDDDTTRTLHHVFQNLAAHDVDAAANLLHALKIHQSSDQNALQLKFDLYVRIVQEQYDENIASMAMFGLSACLGHVEQSEAALISKHDLVNLTDSLVRLPYSGCRDLFNARIRALGSVLAYPPSGSQSIWNQPTCEPLSLWITMLSSAAKDATEVLTRLNAAKSLHGFKGCLLEGYDRIVVKEKLITFSILYDFLSDDDEEIRDIAASTTSSILDSADTRTQTSLCPLAACHQLSVYMADIFSSQHDFHMMVLGRIMLPTLISPEILKDFAATVVRHSVRQQLGLARKESYDLFEEERQNLYLDDIREIGIWCLALGKVSPERMDNHVELLARKWTLEGLRELTVALPSLTSGPFGVLSKLEIITLFMRVIQLADILVQWEYNSVQESTTPIRPACLTEMEQLLSATREFPLHAQAQKALENSVQRGQLGLEQLKRGGRNSQLRERG